MGCLDFGNNFEQKKVGTDPDYIQKIEDYNLQSYKKNKT